MDIYGFAKKLMKDEEFNRGGIIANERKYLDAVGFEYTMADGVVKCGGDDLHKFYEAMSTLLELQKKYSKED